jgi:DNA-directed RNA polymerase specialized sigma24 family protein
MSETLEAPSANAPELVCVTQLARALSAVYTRAFALLKVHGYSGKEIATRLGIPEEAAEELIIQTARVRAQESTTGRSGLAQGPSHLKKHRLRIADDDYCI